LKYPEPVQALRRKRANNRATHQSLVDLIVKDSHTITVYLGAKFDVE
jgi:hypothetical protein